MIAIDSSGEHAYPRPHAYCVGGDPCGSRAVVAAGDLSNCDAVRAFWQSSILALAQPPPEIWLNLTRVVRADTKLAACIVALLRRADRQGTMVHIVGSSQVMDVLDVCRMPPLPGYVAARKAS